MEDLDVNDGNETGGESPLPTGQKSGNYEEVPLTEQPAAGGPSKLVVTEKHVSVSERVVVTQPGGGQP